MIKATTKHGTYYLIDFENNLAMRVKAEDRNEMHGDGQWFRFAALQAYDLEERKADGEIEVGKPMFFWLTGNRHYDWRMSTPVVSIEDYDDSDNSS